MSQTLPSVNLASVSVGQSGVVDLRFTGIDANPTRIAKPAHLMINNESGVGLTIAFLVGGDSFFLPAGGWVYCHIDPGESQLIWTVQYILNVVGGAPVSQLLVTYYAPSDPLPAIPQLGNSPIGGAVSTSSIQTLSNEGNPPVTLVEDIGDTNFAQLYTLNNDGSCSWSVDRSGVKHQVLKTQAAANSLQLGQSGDVSEILGQLKVDQLLTMASQGLTTPAATDMNYNAPSGQQHAFQINSVNQMTLTSTLFSLISGITLDLEGLQTNVGGNTSGTAFIGEITTGFLKLTAIRFSSFQNNSVSDQFFSVASATNFAICIGSDAPWFVTATSGTKHNMSVPSASGNPMPVGSQSIGKFPNLMFTTTGYNQLVFLANDNTGPHNGMMLIAAV